MHTQLARFSVWQGTQCLRCGGAGGGPKARGFLLARLGEAHSREGGRQCFGVHLAASTLQIIVLPSLCVGGLQSMNGSLKLVPLLVTGSSDVASIANIAHSQF